MIEIALVIAFLAIFGLAWAIGHTGGVIAGERQHRKAVIEELNQERQLFILELKNLQTTHNALTQTQAAIDVRLSDLETKMNQLWGTKR